MIIVKSVEDAKAIPEKYRGIIHDRASTLFGLPFWIPDDNGYIILIEKGDDLTELPHLNKVDGGLYCKVDNAIGAFWEYVQYYETTNMYEVTIICNDDFGIGYFIPAELAPDDLRAALNLASVWEDHVTH